MQNIHKNTKRITIFATNHTVCTSIKVANLFLCDISLLGSLMMILCGLKRVGIFGVILLKSVRNNNVHFWIEYYKLITDTARNEQRKLSEKNL